MCGQFDFGTMNLQNSEAARFYRAGSAADAVYSDENSVCLSLCPSVKRVECDKTKEKLVHTKKAFILVFREKRMNVGRPTHST